VLSKFLDYSRSEPAIAAERALREFRTLGFTVPEGNSRNPHKKSAALRTAAVGFIRSLYLNLGLDEYSISMSKRDQRDGVAGSRPYYWAKDLELAASSDKEDGHAYSYVDVDFHVDPLEADLATRSTPTTIFTIIPSKAAMSAESSYTFEEDGDITVNMAGGGCYSHSLWDWTPDTMAFTKRFCGIPIATTICKVEKRNFDDLKAVVILAPVGTWWGPASWIIRRFIECEELERFNCIENGFAHIQYVNENGMMHSIARVNAYTSVELTASEFDSMHIAAITGKSDPTTSAMATWNDQDRVGANIAQAFFRACSEAPRGAFVTRVTEAVTSVSANVKNHGDCEERVSVSAFMQPIVAGNCHAHTDHMDNAKWAVDARITKVRAKTVQSLNPFTAASIKEFVKLCFPTRLCKADLQAVIDKQTRPTQRAIVEEAVSQGPAERRSLKAFLKKEAYGGPKDPRIITTYRPGTKIGYSVYMYAISERLKQQPWYGFKTPVEVAGRIADMCSAVTSAVEGDFSRMDGRVDANVRRTFEKAILNAAFPGDDEVHRLHELQYDQQVALGSETYSQGYARGSGSPETSAFNTLLTAFVLFYSMRLLRRDAKEAYELIGIAAGDDSLQPVPVGVEPADMAVAIERAARQMGQKLTSNVKHIGEPVTFLSRVFGGAWHGDTNSMACPLRLLSKVHSAVNIGAVRPEDKCRTKGESILPGDANTPIIGDLARKMITVGNKLSGLNATRLQTWWNKFEDCAWPNRYDSWMDDVIYAEMPDFDHRAFDDWIRDGHPLQAPTCYSVTPGPGSLPVLVGGDTLCSSISSVGASGPTSESSAKVPSPRPRKKNVKIKKKNAKPQDANVKPQAEASSEGEIPETASPQRGRGSPLKVGSTDSRPVRRASRGTGVRRK
jgi:hypothetical protein